MAGALQGKASHAMRGDDLSLTIANLTRDFFETPSMRALKGVLHSLELNQQVLHSLRAHEINSIVGLDPDRITGLTSAISELSASGKLSDFDLDDLGELELWDEEQEDVLAAGEAVADAVEHLNNIEDKLDTVNAAMSQIERLLEKYQGHRLGSAGSYSYAYLVETDHAVQSVVCVDDRPVDAIRESRATVTELGVPRDVVRLLRVVKTRSLGVYDGGQSRDEPIDRLPMGTVVEVVARGGKWRHVRWHNPESDEPNEGWVRAKNLAKLHAP